MALENISEQISTNTDEVKALREDVRTVLELLRHNQHLPHVPIDRDLKKLGAASKT